MCHENKQADKGSLAFIYLYYKNNVQWSHYIARQTIPSNVVFVQDLLHWQQFCLVFVQYGAQQTIVILNNYDLASLLRIQKLHISSPAVPY